MKKLHPLLALFGGCLFLLNMQSCSTKQGMVSCPDLHRANHHQMAMHKTPHQSDHVAVAKQDNKQHPQNNDATAVNADRQASSGGIAPLGTASISSDVPVIKHPKDVFKILTEDERQQVKDHLSNMFAKRPMLKNIALRKFDKLDKKYPAPAESVLRQGGGGGLGVGEILAIVAIVLSLTFFLSIVGLILGIVALIKLNNDGGAGWAKILAILAIIFGALFFIIFLIGLIIVLAIGGGFFLF